MISFQQFFKGFLLYAFETLGVGTQPCDGKFLTWEDFIPPPWPCLRGHPAWSQPLCPPGLEPWPSVGRTPRMRPHPRAAYTCLDTVHFLGSHLRGACTLCWPLGRQLPCEPSLQGDPVCQDCMPAQTCYWSPAPPVPQVPVLISSESHRPCLPQRTRVRLKQGACPSKTSYFPSPGPHVTSSFLLLTTHYHKRNAASTEDELQLCSLMEHHP